MSRIQISECVYANDIAITGNTGSNLQHKVDLWANELESKRMRINTYKLKTMIASNDIEQLIFGNINKKYIARARGRN